MKAQARETGNVHEEGTHLQEDGKARERNSLAGGGGETGVQRDRERQGQQERSTSKGLRTLRKTTSRVPQFGWDTSCTLTNIYSCITILCILASLLSQYRPVANFCRKCKSKKESVRGREAKHVQARGKAHQRGIKCVQERSEAWGAGWW